MEICVEEFVRDLQKARLWERLNIPFYQPQIAFDILVFAVLSARDSDGVNMKNIHLASGHSEDRVRQIVRKLAADGWVSVEQSEGDGRSKFILPTQKLLSLFADYKMSARL